MTNAELPYLNLDAATSLYLPLEPIEARAHYRFAFRLPNGDEEWLLARLCVEDSPDSDGKSVYVVVLHPEKAEKSRIFVVDNFEYRSGKRKTSHIMTGSEANKFNWDLFVQSFNEEKNRFGICRFWHKMESGKLTLLRFSLSGGDVVGFMDETGNWTLNYGAEFRWKRQFYREHRAAVLKFLRLQDTSFKRKVRLLWNNPSSELRFVLRWITLSDEECHAIAFECKNGDWEELRKIARLVLQLRVSILKRVPQSNFTWSFFGQGHIFVRWISELDEDDTLFLWRLALTHAFQTTNFDICGVKEDSLPYELANYIRMHNRSKIEASPPSMHEILEANLKLDVWTKAHFSPENAKILMASLKRFSKADAQKLYDSLIESNLK